MNQKDVKIAIISLQRAGYTLKDIASMAGCAESTIIRIKSGVIKSNRVHLADKIISIAERRTNNVTANKETRTKNNRKR